MDGTDSCYGGYASWAATFAEIEQLKHLKRADKKPTPEEIAVSEMIYKPVFTRGGNSHTYRKGNV